MSKVDVVPTPLDSIPKIAGGIRTAFNTHKTTPLEYRLVQLRKLYWAYVPFPSTPPLEAPLTVLA